MESINPQKYVELQKKLLQEAREEAIALLRCKTDNQFVMSEEPEYACEDWLFTRDGNNCAIQLYAYGLKEEGELCFKAWYEASDNDYQGGEWCEFEENGINNLYCEVYEIIAEHVLANHDAHE